MTFERARRKLELALDREAEKAARAEDKLLRARRNQEVATRQMQDADRRTRYFRDQLQNLTSVERAVN